MLAQEAGRGSANVGVEAGSGLGVEEELGQEGGQGGGGRDGEGQYLQDPHLGVVELLGIGHTNKKMLVTRPGRSQGLLY